MQTFSVRSTVVACQLTSNSVHAKLINLLFALLSSLRLRRSLAPSEQSNSCIHFVSRALVVRLFIGKTWKVNSSSSTLHLHDSHPPQADRNNEAHLDLLDDAGRHAPRALEPLFKCSKCRIGSRRHRSVCKYRHRFGSSKTTFGRFGLRCRRVASSLPAKVDCDRNNKFPLKKTRLELMEKA
jgi:hypothetical protein